MKTKTEKTILITKRCSYYQSIGTELVGFCLSQYHNHAVILTKFLSLEADPWTNEKHWEVNGKTYEPYPDHANMNDRETQELIDSLKSKNKNFYVDPQIIEELKALN